MTEDLAIKTIKNILLNGNDVRGKEAEDNLRWALQEYLKEQLILHGVVKSLKEKKEMSFGVWKMKCKDIEYIDRKLVKYKGNLMSYNELEKQYHTIKHTL